MVSSINSIVAGICYDYTTPIVIAGDPLTASFNTLSINTAAASGQQVRISGNGIVYINSTLIGKSFLIDSNTIITCIPSVVNGPAFPAFRNINFNPTRYTISSITGAKVAVGGGGTAGRFVVNMAGHNLTAGQYLYINGDTSENWNGIWTIESVVPGTSVTILTGFANPPTGYTIPSPTGTPLGCIADTDFQVIGGTINMNFLNGGFSASNNYLDHGINANNTFRTRINTRIIYACKYGVCIQNSVDPRVQLDGQSFADGIHFYGPCWNPIVESLTGSWGDDGAVFQTVDGPTYLGFMLPENGRTFPGGHIYNGKISNVNITWTGNSAAAPLYPASGISASAGSGVGYTWAAGDLGFRFKGQQILDGVGHSFTGATNFYSSGAVAVGNGYVLTTGFIESLVIRGLRYSFMSLANTGGGLISIGQLILEVAATDTYIGYPLSSNLDQMSIKSFIIKGGNFKNTNTNSPNVVTFVSSACNITSLTFEQCIFAGGTGPNMYVFGLQASGGTLGSVNFNQCVGLDGAGLVDLNSFTLSAVPRITLNGGDYTHRSALIPVGTAQAVDVYANDVKISSGTGQAALLNSYSSGKIRVFSKGAQFGGSAIPYLNISSGNTCEWYNPDGSIPVDITKLARTRNQVAVHNGATTAGTIVANNLCVSDSTQAVSGWKQLSNTALLY